MTNTGPHSRYITFQFLVQAFTWTWSLFFSSQSQFCYKVSSIEIKFWSRRRQISKKHYQENTSMKQIGAYLVLIQLTSGTNLEWTLDKWIILFVISIAVLGGIFGGHLWFSWKSNISPNLSTICLVLNLTQEKNLHWNFRSKLECSVPACSAWWSC